jgi:hypothetical protein
MKTLSRFVAKFTSLIVAVLSCLDRVIFKGHVHIANAPALEGFVDHVLKISRCDLMAAAEQKSEALVRVPIARQAVTNDLMVADSDKNSARSDKGRGPTRRTVYHDGRWPRNWSGVPSGRAGHGHPHPHR